MKYKLIAVAVACAFIQACETAEVREIRGAQAMEMSRGMEKKVRFATVYDGSGKMLRTWAGEMSVATKGSTAWLFLENGAMVVIGGTFVIEDRK